MFPLLLAALAAIAACRRSDPPSPPPPPLARPQAHVETDAADPAQAPYVDAGDPDANLFALLGAGNASDAGDPDASPPDAGPRAWRRYKEKHFQIVSPPGEPPEETDLREGNRGACPAGMVEVTGNMIAAFMMDERQQSVCTKWINRNFPERCAEFDRPRWLAETRGLPRRAMHFCIDRYEYPNKKGEYPVLFVNWNEANDLCEGEGKRLCSENEWTFACEGEEAIPYPYGYVRDTEACVVDKTWLQYYPQAFSTPEGTQKELDRLWQGAPSGARPRCKSPFGVYDMIGNVDEWTRSSTKEGRPSVLKGGYWGPVRTRCRPWTRAHGELHAFYQQGLRCCSSLPPTDAGAEADAAADAAGR